MTTPFDDIRALLDALPGPTAAPPPRRSLGRLDEIAAWLSAWSGRSPPSLSRPIIAVYAGGHGVAEHLPSAPPVRGLLEAMAAGIAPVAQAAQAQGAGLDVFDLALDRPVGDITLRAAMSEKECAATMAFGMEALAKQPDLLILGEAGHGGEIAAAALCHALFDGEAAEWSEHPALVTAAVSRAKSEAAGPLDLLRQLGSREMAAQAGAILAARTEKTPVILDSFGGCTAARRRRPLHGRAGNHREWTRRRPGPARVEADRRAGTARRDRGGLGRRARDHKAGLRRSNGVKRLIPLLLLAACSEPADAPRPVEPPPSVQAFAPAPAPQPRVTAPGPNSPQEARRIALEHLQAQHPNRPVVMGEPGPMEGAAGSIFIEVPARVVLEPESLAGTVTLRRVNDVPGSTPEERRWRVYRTDLKPLQ